MASDSEPRKFFSRPPRGPLRIHISGSKKPVRLVMSNMTQLDGQQQQRQLQNYIEHNTRRLFWQHQSCREGFLSQCVDDEATPRMHAWQTVFCQLSSILVLSNWLNCSFSHLANKCFYPRDAMLARVIAIATCLSVCLSVTRQYCVKTKKASVMISSPSGSPMILVFWRQVSSPNTKGFPRTGASK